MNMAEEPARDRPRDQCAGLESRRGLYRLFNRLLSEEIDQQLLEKLRAPGFSAAMGEMGICLDDLSGCDGQVLEKLSVEFAHLFLGPGKHISPHQSVHIGREGILNDGTTVQVRRFIEAAGFQLRADSGRYPDHVGSEFEFMDELIGRQIEAIRNEDYEEAETSKMLQQEFLQRHLIQWLPEFCLELERSANLSLYRTLAKAVSDFIHMDHATAKLGT